MALLYRVMFSVLHTLISCLSALAPPAGRASRVPLSCRRLLSRLVPNSAPSIYTLCAIHVPFAGFAFELVPRPVSVPVGGIPHGDRAIVGLFPPGRLHGHGGGKQGQDTGDLLLFLVQLESRAVRLASNIQNVIFSDAPAPVRCDVRGLSTVLDQVHITCTSTLLYMGKISALYPARDFYPLEHHE